MHRTIRAVSKTILLVAVTIAIAMPASTAHASDRIWAALVLATNETPAKPAPEKLKPFAAALEKIFGYNTFYLLGDKRKQICENTDEWLVPSKGFFLHVKGLNKEIAAYELSIDLYARKELMFTSRVKLARGAPLYIRGPQWGKGQLLYILEIQ